MRVTNEVCRTHYYAYTTISAAGETISYGLIKLQDNCDALDLTEANSHSIVLFEEHVYERHCACKLRITLCIEFDIKRIEVSVNIDGKLTDSSGAVGSDFRGAFDGSG